MSEIQFKDLEIENFLSVGSGELSLNNRGLLLIQGQNNDNPSANSNGAGKSSVVDALCWGLYGVTARGVKGDAVVNRFEGKNCRVSISFTLDGKVYQVQRYRKHTKGKNRLHFTVDGADLTLGTDALTQEVIEKTIGCNLEVFAASIYAAQENMPNLPAMTDKELKQLVEKASGIELLDAAYSIARDRVRSASMQRDTAINDHNTAKTQQENAKLALEQAVEQRDQWDLDQAERIKAETTSVSSRMLEARALKTEVDGFNTSDLEAERDRLKAEIAKPKPSLPHIPDPEQGETLQPKPYPGTPQEVIDLDRKIGKAEAVRDGIKADLVRNANEVKSVSAIVGTPCGECGKEYCEADIGERKRILMGALATGKTRLAEADLWLAEASQELNAHREAHDRERADIDEHNARVKAHNDAVRREWIEGRAAARKQREKQAADAAAADTSHALVDALSDVQRALSEQGNKRSTLALKLDELRQAKYRLDQLKAQVNPHGPTIERAYNRLANADHTVDDKLKAANDADEYLADVATAAELFSPKGMRGEILDQVTPFLNARTAQYLGVLTDGTSTAEWKTVGETGKGELREKFHIAVTNEHGAEVYEGNSGGEKRKVRVATAMALQDLVASRADRPIKLFIADEADDALDVSGLERLMTILEDKARSVGTVLVISHNDLGDWISNSVTVLKTGGKSHIIEV